MDYRKSVSSHIAKRNRNLHTQKHLESAKIRQHVIKMAEWKHKTEVKSIENEYKYEHKLYRQ